MFFLLEIAIIVVLVLFGAATYRGNSPLLSLISFALILGVVYWTGWFNPFAFGVIGIVAGLIGFILVGGVYVLLVMWPELLRERSDYLKHIIEVWNDPKKADLRKGYTHWNQTREYRDKFSATQNKGILAGMVAVWPWDLLDKLFNKPIEWVLSLSRNIFDAVGGRVVNKMAAQMPPKLPTDEK